MRHPGVGIPRIMQYIAARRAVLCFFLAATFLAVAGAAVLAVAGAADTEELSQEDFEKGFEDLDSNEVRGRFVVGYILHCIYAICQLAVLHYCLSFVVFASLYMAQLFFETQDGLVVLKEFQDKLPLRGFEQLIPAGFESVCCV